MGQAKLRGSFDERKSEAIYYQAEQERLDSWLEARQPPRKRRKRGRVSVVGAACIALGMSITPKGYYKG